MSTLERRTFLAFAAALACSRLPQARADSRGATVGVIMGLANDSETQARSGAFEEGMRRDGWIPGQNLRLVYRFANADRELMKSYARELVAMNCDCIVGHSTPVAAALQATTKTIPIVFVSVSDPIGSGFVANMAHPGGNMTGFTVLQATITGKYLSMLMQLDPKISRVALMYNPDSVPGSGEFFMPAFRDSAATFKVEPIDAAVRNEGDIENAMTNLGARSGAALITVPDNFLSLHRDLIVVLAAKYSIPAIYPYRYFAEAGGLMSYGVDAVDLFERSTDYVSRILRGAKPADLPVQGPTKFEMVINIKTARTLGLTVPRFLLVGADAVVD
jgi:putative ABC transport system substrate-binding protein